MSARRIRVRRYRHCVETTESQRVRRGCMLLRNDAGSLRLNLREHLQQISVGIAKEQRAMSEGAVGGRRTSVTPCRTSSSAQSIDVGGGNLERQLQFEALPAGVGASDAVRLGRASASVLPPS